MLVVTSTPCESKNMNTGALSPGPKSRCSARARCITSITECSTLYGGLSASKSAFKVSSLDLRVMAVFFYVGSWVSGMDDPGEAHFILEEHCKSTDHNAYDIQSLSRLFRPKPPPQKNALTAFWRRRPESPPSANGHNAEIAPPSERQNILQIDCQYKYQDRPK